MSYINNFDDDCCGYICPYTVIPEPSPTPSPEHFENEISFQHTYVSKRKMSHSDDSSEYVCKKYKMQ